MIYALLLVAIAFTADGQPYVEQSSAFFVDEASCVRAETVLRDRAKAVANKNNLTIAKLQSVCVPVEKPQAT
jgi:hypothetical protein